MNRKGGGKMFLAKNLKYLRLKNGFSQDYIADKLGYKSYTTIQKWEMGTSEPSISTLKKLSRIYNVDIQLSIITNAMYKIILTPIKLNIGVLLVYYSIYIHACAKAPANSNISLEYTPKRKKTRFP